MPEVQVPYTAPALELNSAFYHLNEEEKDFFQHLTGITDDEELKAHIIKVQTMAYEKFKYPCIRGFSFLHLNIAHLPAYSQVQGLRGQRDHPLFLDLGCGFGNALRKLVVDGWPAEDTIACDLHQGFWDYGHQLFKSTPKTFRAGFVAGDIFDPSILAPRGAYITEEDIATICSAPIKPLQKLASLTPLQGKLSVVHAASFFHLFSEEKQLELAHRVSSLVSPEPGSIIFGSHIALPEKGIRKEEGRDWNMFCHSPETWKDVWLTVFDNGDGKGAERVKIDTEMFRVPVQGPWVAYTQLSDKSDMWLMRWSVTRI